MKKTGEEILTRISFYRVYLHDKGERSFSPTRTGFAYFYALFMQMSGSMYLDSKNLIVGACYFSELR